MPWRLGRDGRTHSMALQRFTYRVLERFYEVTAEPRAHIVKKGGRAQQKLNFLLACLSTRPSTSTKKATVYSRDKGTRSKYRDEMLSWTRKRAKLKELKGDFQVSRRVFIS